MLDIVTFNKFIGKANQAHQQFCVWFEATNEFAKHQTRWNTNPVDYPEESLFGCRYKNFFDVSIVSTQHGWILGTARLFDPPFQSKDKNKEKPRISLDYVLFLIDDDEFCNKIKSELQGHISVIDSIRKHRHNFLAHNDSVAVPTRIEAGFENLFLWLEEVIARIKDRYPELNSGRVINIEYNEKLAKLGVQEVFKDLTAAENF